MTSHHLNRHLLILPVLLITLFVLIAAQPEFAVAAPPVAGVSDDVSPSVSSFSGTPASFSPNGDGIQDSTLISGTISEAASVTLDIQTSGGTLVKRLAAGVSKSAGKVSYRWNGKNNSGKFVTDGTYTAKMTLSDPSGNAGSATATVYVDRTLSRVYSGRVRFSPNGDGIKDGTTVIYRLSRSARVNIVVRTSGGSYVKTVKDRWYTAGVHVNKWDGKFFTGLRVKSGTYKIYVTTTNSYGSMVRTATVKADLTKPAVSKVVNTNSIAPFDDSYRDSRKISFYTSEAGTARITIIDPWGRTVINKNIGSKNAGWNSYRWNGVNSNGVNVPGGTYRYRYSVTDVAGNTGRSVQRTIPISSTIKAGNVSYSIGHILIDLSQQTLYAYDRSGKRRFAILISSGLPGSPTPTGNYRIQKKKRILLARNLTVYADWPSYFLPHYAIHGWPKTLSGYGLRGILGQRASHGCVRSEDAYAKFIQDHVAIGGTTVKVRR